jgi:hypothetical protein
MKVVGLLVAVGLSLWVSGCSATKGGTPGTAVPTTDQTKTDAQSQLGMFDATILFTDCSKVSNYSATLAEKTMRRLVEGCDSVSVPGGQAEFVATLQPGGRIEISPVEGEDGTVPICVLKHQLEHQVNVRQACKMHVQMEQKLPTPRTGTGTPISSH